MLCRIGLLIVAIQLMGVVIAIDSACAQAKAPASAAAPSDGVALGSQRADANSKTAHEELVAKARKGGIDLYFVGDSITRRWGCSDPQWAEMYRNWQKNFYGWNAGDFGWGGDGIQHILWRMQNGELEGVHPKVIVILAGTNNIGTRPGGPQKVEDIADGLQAIVSTCHRLAPDAKLILTGIFPRNDNMAVLPEISSVNQRLAAMADGKSVFYININDKLADPDGRLHDGMTIDKLHPTVQGYQLWADALKPILTRLLGPPAATDHAPPPTADPSIRQDNEAP